MEKNTEVPQKTKNKTTIWCRNPSPGYMSRIKKKKKKNTNCKRHVQPNVHRRIAAIFIMVKTWKNAVSFNRWMDWRKYDTHTHTGEGYGYPFQYSCLENLMDRGVWKPKVHGVIQSLTWLKQLSTKAHTQTHTYGIIHTNTHSQNGILLSHKKNEIMSFATLWMDLDSIMLSKICLT